jgi:hypothetical protein
MQRNIEAFLLNHCCFEKALIITHSMCVSVALVIKHVRRMRHIVICGLSGCTIYFSTLSHKRLDTRGGELSETNICYFFSLQILFEIFRNLGRIHAKYFHTCTSVITYSGRYFWQILMKL